MAVVFIEGFDSYNGVGVPPGVTARWTLTSGIALAAAMVAGRFGGQAFETDENRIAAAALPAAYGAVAVGFAYRFTDVPSGIANAQAFMSLSNTGTYHFGWRHTSAGAIEVYRMSSASAGTLLGTSAAGVVTFGTWHYIEIEYVCSDTVGVVNVYVDSVSVLALAGQDTRNGATSTVNEIRIGIHVDNNNGQCEYDDIYVTDSAVKLGERRVETLYPSADVAAGAWVPSTGVSHFAMVDEATVNVADYISASVVGDTDRFTHAGLSTTPASIDAVQVVAWGNKTDATARSIALQVKSGATTVDGANFALPATVNQIRGDLKLTDPNTGVAWTAAGVNALEFGVKVTV